jgi:cytochrome c oxidase subunit 2
MEALMTPGPLPNIFDPVSTPALAIRDLSWLLFAVTGAILAVVAGVLVYAVVRFRHRRGDDAAEPAQVYGSNPIELAWTVAPLLIVLVLFLVTARTVFTLERHPPADALRVAVIGHQWWWEFRYPVQGVVTANELHVPVSDPARPRPVFLTLESEDVVHSFWIPQLAGKTDVIPNRTNTMWIEPLKTGTFLGQCAEFCGTQHANMLLRVVVEPPPAFEAWLDAQRQPAADVASARAGRAVFESNPCASCHTVQGTSARGTVGPDLTHLMSRETLGAGAVPNDGQHLLAWVRNPGDLKPGVRMPAMRLDHASLTSLVAWLETLH